MSESKKTQSDVEALKPSTATPSPEKPAIKGQVNCDFELDQVEALIEEATAMARYISRDGEALGDKTAALHGKLLNALKNITCEKDANNWVALHLAYAEVTAITYPAKGVNGRTILDTNAKVGRVKSLFFQNARHRPVIVGLFLFVFALFLEVVASWVAKVSFGTQYAEIRQGFFFLVASSLITFLLPAVWGGIGSCIFLMKRLSDKLFDQAYQSSKVKGDMTRVYLGAMLGVIIVVVMFPGFGDAVKIGDFTFGPASAAFVAGLGVKPIYAAFESLSEELAARFTRNKDVQTGTTTKPEGNANG